MRAKSARCIRLAHRIKCAGGVRVRYFRLRAAGPFDQLLISPMTLRIWMVQLRSVQAQGRGRLSPINRRLGLGPRVMTQNTLRTRRNPISPAITLARVLQILPIHHHRCAPCWNQYAHMQFFFVTTPELQLLINLVATPLTLLVSLWGMTDVRALELMSSNRQELEALRVQKQNGFV